MREVDSGTHVWCVSSNILKYGQNTFDFLSTMICQYTYALGLLSIRLGQFRGNAINVIICGSPFGYHCIMIDIGSGFSEDRSSSREIKFES